MIFHEQQCGVHTHSHLNIQKSNSVALSEWIDFDWVWQSHLSEHWTLVEFNFQTNVTQSNKSNAIHLIVFDWVYPPNCVIHWIVFSYEQRSRNVVSKTWKLMLYRINSSLGKLVLIFSNSFTNIKSSQIKCSTQFHCLTIFVLVQFCLISELFQNLFPFLLIYHVLI